VSVLFVLVPVALAIVLAAVIAFAWSARSGQFDDLRTPALRPLIDEPPSEPGAPPVGEGNRRPVTSE